MARIGACRAGVRRFALSLSYRNEPYNIPSYSLTGDLLAYNVCGLQYRYHNRGSLPPSRPVQLWFGEFIHGVMDESYRRWRVSQASGPLLAFPWAWKPAIFDVEQYVVARLAAKGLNPLSNLWDRTGSNQLIASQRTEFAINTWGKELFPLIQEAELLLQGIRPMPSLPPPSVARSDYYEIKGVVDVLSSVRLAAAPPANAILSALRADP